MQYIAHCKHICNDLKVLPINRFYKRRSCERVSSTSVVSHYTEEREKQLWDVSAGSHNEVQQ